MDPNAALQAVLTWSPEDQLEFAFRVWDQIVDNGWEQGLTDDMKAELNARLAAHESDPTNVVTWDQLVAHVKRPR